jgi:hypothetical protein
MTLWKLGEFMLAEPFQPFRIKMASGQTYDIRYPEMILVGRTKATLFTFLGDNPEEGNVRQVEVSLLLIESVEPLTAAA